MANRFIIQTGGATSGDCLTLGTGGTLAYVMGSTGPVVAGDNVYWCAGVGGATYDITSATQLLVRFQATGTAGAPINVYGCNSSGVVDGSRPEVRATGTWATAISYFVIGTDAAAAPLRYVNWYNIDWNANSTSSTTGSYNVFNNSGIITTGIGTATTSYYHTFTNCIFRDSKHNGVSLFSGAAGSEVDDSFTFTNCVIRGCGISTSNGNGMIGRGTTATACTWNMDRCTVTGNYFNGVRIIAASDKLFRATGCTFSSQAFSAGIECTQQALALYGCTFQSNAEQGLVMPWKATSSVERCRFLSNTGVGLVDSVADGTETFYPYQRNAYFGNGGGAYADTVEVKTPPGNANVFVPNFPNFRGRRSSRSGGVQ